MLDDEEVADIILDDDVADDEIDEIMHDAMLHHAEVDEDDDECVVHDDAELDE